MRYEKFAIRNVYGDTYTLERNKADMYLLKATGIGYAQNDVNISTEGFRAGGVYNSNHINSRNIVFDLVMFGENAFTRKKLYKIFPQDSAVRIFCKNLERDVYIDGYVESIDTMDYNYKEKSRVSIICPNPYWHDVEEIVKTVNSVCTIENDGDCNVGFTATITIDTDETATLEMSEEAYDPPSIMQSTVYVPFPAAWYPDGDKYLKVYVNGILKSSGYTTDFIEYTTSTRDLKIVFDNSTKLNAGDVVKVDVVEDYTDTETKTDSPAASRQMYDQYQYPGMEIPKPSWYDSASSQSVKLCYDDGSDVQTADFYYIDTGDYFSVIYRGATPTEYPYKIMYTVISGDVSVQKSRVDNTQSVTVTYPYKLLINPSEIGYDVSNDAIRIYTGGNEVENYTTESAEDSENNQLLCIRFGTQITMQTILQIISSISGDDVSEYTDSQIMEGLLLVQGLKLRNTTTDEQIIFHGIQFQPGDVIEVSTVRGDVHVTLKESNWMPPGTNLLYTVYDYGKLFELVKGDNTLMLSANTNTDFVSAEIKTQLMYGGV